MGMLERANFLRETRDRILKEIYANHPRSIASKKSGKIDFY